MSTARLVLALFFCLATVATFAPSADSHHRLLHLGRPTTTTTTRQATTTTTTTTVAPATTTTTAAPVGVHAVPASIAADCSRPVEAALMAFFATVPNGATIRFAAGGCYGQDGSIEVVDRSGLTFDGNGSTFRALTVGGSHRSNWKLRGGANLTLRNMAVRGSNDAGGITAGAYVGALEWQHGYSVEGTQGATLDAVRASHVYGDLIGVQVDERAADWRTAPPARNVVVRGARLERNGRQGVALTHVDGFTMTDSWLGEVNQNAVDAEADLDEHVVRNVDITDNTFGRVRFALFANLGAGSGPNQGPFRIERNTMTAGPVTCLPPVLVGANPGQYRIGYTVVDNVLVAYGNASEWTRARGVTVARNRVSVTPGGGCGHVMAGAALVDSHDVAVTGNAFAGESVAVSADGASTGVSQSGNTL